MTPPRRCLTEGLETVEMPAQVVAPRHAAEFDESELDVVETSSDQPSTVGGRRRPFGPAVASLALAAVLGAGLFVPSHSDDLTADEAVVSAVPVEPSSSATRQLDDAISRSQGRQALGQDVVLGKTLSAPQEAHRLTAAEQAAQRKAAAKARKLAAAQAARAAKAKKAAAERARLAEQAKLVDSLKIKAVTNWLTEAAYIRSDADLGSAVLTTVLAGDEVKNLGRTRGQFTLVSKGKTSGWMRTKFLTATDPSTGQDSDGQGSTKKSDGSSSGSQTDSSSTSQGGSVSSSAPCPAGSRIESGLTPRAIRVYRAVCAQFPFVKSYGGYRPEAGSYHGSGRAIDVMVSGERGWEIARWARNNAGRLGIVEVIYSQKIWGSYRSGDGWRHMSDRGSATANHYDHVHLSIR